MHEDPDKPRASVTEIFAAAAERPRAERPSYLDAACGNNGTLRARVEQLLAVHDGTFPPETAPTVIPWGGGDGFTTQAMPREGAGSTIGRYRLLQLLGQGGFGSVFLAEQEKPVRRKVALKIIKLGMDSEQVIARFEAERQALALMDHPSIAKVFDAGATDTGRPYFVMELVKGVPITQYCDTSGLTTIERLELFIEVCDAVQHAHQKGIIHRDLKPSNVMVGLQDGRPVPKVIDFGIAKATNARLTERTLFTEYRQFIGTPEYMSPEQAEMSGLDVDTRSDIYSLGVLLYELLTGRTPFDPEALRSGGYGEIQRIIRDIEPPKPSARMTMMEHGTGPRTAVGDGIDATEVRQIARHRRTDLRSLKRTLRGDLDWIVMKALEKDRTRRYDTAIGLARDVERHLRDEPVLASPPSASYRLGKLFRRRRRTVVAASLIVLALVLGTVGTSIGMISARRGWERARERAEVTEAVTEFLNKDLLAAVQPSSERGRGREVGMRDVLDVAAERIDEASRPGGRFADKPLVEAGIRLTLGETYRLLGLLPAAERHIPRTVELYRNALGDEHADTLAARHALARLYRSQARYPAAETLDLETLEIRRRVLGDDHPDTLDSVHNLGVVYLGQGRVEAAEPLLVEAFEKRERVLGEDDGRTVASMSALALLRQTTGHWDEAEELCARALAIHGRVRGPKHASTVAAVGSLAALHRLRARYAEAEKLYRRALAIQNELMGDEHSHTLWTMVALAEVLHLQGHTDEAEPVCARANELYAVVLEAEHPATLTAKNLMATIYRALGRYDEAVPIYEFLLGVEERKHGRADPRTVGTMIQLAEVHLAAGNAAEARRLLAEALDHHRAAADRPDASPEGLNFCAWLLLTCEPADLRDPEAALRYARRANDLTGHEHVDHLDTLALAWFRSGDVDRAVETQRAALELVPADRPEKRAEFEARLREYEAAREE